MTQFEMIIVISVGLIFSAHVFLDVVGILPRIAGTKIGKSNLGYSFQIIIATFKRVLGVSYPPILGLLVIRFDLEQLFYVVALAYSLSLVGLAFAVISRARLLLAFEHAIQNYADGKNTLRALAVGSMKSFQASANEIEKANSEFSIIGSVDRRLILLGSWVFGVYSVSMFTINLVASAIPQLATVILQCGGLINAFGTVIMAFFYDPNVSKKLDEGADKGMIYRSIVSANLIAVSVFAPLYFVSLYFILA